jgi:hypothetical protein
MSLPLQRALMIVLLIVMIYLSIRWENYTFGALYALLWIVFYRKLDNKGKGE